MPWAQHESGTQVAVIDTEHTLGTDPQTVDGTFALFVDLTNLAAGDVVLFRFYESLTGTGDTPRGMILGTAAGVQVNALWFSIPVIHIHEGRFTLEQTDGTGRSFDWSIRTIT